MLMSLCIFCFFLNDTILENAPDHDKSVCVDQFFKPRFCFRFTEQSKNSASPTLAETYRLLNFQFNIDSISDIRCLSFLNGRKLRLSGPFSNHAFRGSIYRVAAVIYDET
jgi:hypothetical protein